MSDAQPDKQEGDARGHEAVGAAFDLLHPGVQKQLWRMGWKSLRPLQVRAIHAILEGRGHAIFSAATASGKTEAAFLPILSRIADAGDGSVRAVYVGPLKALINDQFRRVEDLCGYLDVPVHRWHGDVGASHKSRLLAQPAGVLLITPESLESLFVNRSANLGGLFGALAFVVIDELHSFLDNERGLHLRSLLSRLARLSGDEVRQQGGLRIVGLSATIGEPELARQFVDSDRPGEVRWIEEKSDGKEIKYRIHGYRVAPAPADEDDPEGGAQRAEIARQIVSHCKGQANLIFANSKADVEEYADLARRSAEEQHLGDVFLVHHGSLSVEIREDAEATMKSARTATAFCSSTLEMGIDIGSVRMVGQIGPPGSVSSTLQRMGRSGRHGGEPRIMRVYVECDEPSADASIFHRLHLPLVQAAAVSELMLEHWMEPCQPPACDLSTLSHQVMSVIAETAGAPASEIHLRLCGKGAFGDVDAKLFAALLRRLGQADVIEQMPGGDLVLGLLGERLRRDRGFYAVFPTAREYTILHAGQPLGTLEVAPQQGDCLLFAGKRWRVERVDDERREIHVAPARGYKRPSFAGGLGDVHPMIRRKMRQVLTEDKAYAYLDEQAASLLADARAAARSADICRQGVVALGPRKTAVFTWTGTRVQATLQAMLAGCGVASQDEGIALVLGVSEDEARSRIKEIARQEHNPLEVAQMVQPKERRKYDWLLGEDLLNISLARGWLDLDGAAAVLAELTGRKANPQT
ncbi:MAG: putative ATP-dependent helicase Lhr [Planctomycetes bacterium ADurb.Bin126]|nr:MAG: putative ATP-dependent helicase Lhr [Planctomycetes bacterium ADurb.Bin126]HOD81585.1 DEAD/DEAH box helicase [Phycisphaerae bacterium]HQL71863.1 DEAD/DEAH box helicase [Phycisphaerae bacterium]